MATGRKTGGRQKGIPNKLTGDVKNMILGALQDAGGRKYLLAQSKANPAAFMVLVGKMLPLQVTGANDGPIQYEDVRAPIASLIAPAGVKGTEE